MIKLIVFNDGDVTFEYNNEGLAHLNVQQKFIESKFGIMTDEEAIATVKLEYPELSEEKILNELKQIFRMAYKEILPGFLKKMRDNNPNISIAIATEHTKYVSDYLKDFVDEYYISNEIGFNKSDPSFFQTIINKNNLNPRDILYIDYDINNINVARQVGISTKQVEINDLNLENKVVHTQLGHRLIDSMNELKRVKQAEEEKRIKF